MAINAIESDFRSSKMTACGHFVKINLNWIRALIWNGEKSDRKWFSIIQKKYERDIRSFKMAAGGHFAGKKNQKI